MEDRNSMSRKRGLTLSEDGMMNETYNSNKLKLNLESQSSDRGSLKGDWGNIMLLILLYVLQGIPLGLAGSMSLILQSRKVGYSDQALFSFVFWPFSVKLLWAPIVDSFYSSRFGRRKTWLVPTQYLIGISMFILSFCIVSLIEPENNQPPWIFLLVVIFFLFEVLAATQDIAVDGWALTMLSRRNVGYASTCNSVGQTAGYFLGNVLFLALESPDFCNKYLRSIPEEKGLVTLPGFFWFWGMVFIVVTTLVWFLKHEKADRELDSANSELSILEAYQQLYKICFLPNVKMLIIVLLTSKIGFSAVDAITSLKLIEAGVPKEDLAIIGVPMVPVQILLPILISRYTAGARPLDIYLKAIPYRLLMGIVFAIIVLWTQSLKPVNNKYPWYFYAVILIGYGLHQITLYSMFVAVMAFFARISDPAVGGTYMTLLNTISNLGGNWPNTLALSLVDYLTWTRCEGQIGMNCDNQELSEKCIKEGGTCVKYMDGYYIEVAICTIIGFLWLKWGRNQIQELQSKNLASWSSLN